MKNYNLLSKHNRSFLVAGFALILFFILVLLGFHGASIGHWNNFIYDVDTVESSTLWGRPRSVRSDEWLVLTPFMLSQVERDFPTVNPSLGGGKTPLLMNLPARHFSSFFKPHLWGFFLFSPETAFSFYWNWKVFGLILSSFALFMILTKKNVPLSILGALWIFLSNFIQWWFSIPMIETIIAANCVFIGLYLLLFSLPLYLRILGSLMFFYFSLSFAFVVIYPPFQISLVYLFAFLFVGLVLKERQNITLFQGVKIKASLLGISIFLIMIFLGLFALDMKETFEIITNTSYPGQRVTRGGVWGIDRYFAGYFDVFFRQRKVPERYDNVCEASGYIFLFPLVIGYFCIRGWNKLKKEPLILFLFLFIALFSAWIFFPLPEIFASLTLLNMIPPNRTFLGIGLANIFLVIIFLSQYSGPWFKNKSKMRLATFLSFLFLIFIGAYFQVKTDGIISSAYIMLAIVVLTQVCSFIIKGKGMTGLILLLLFLLPNARINPGARGLGPIYDSSFSRSVQEYHEKHPNAKWLIFGGGGGMSNFMKAFGMDVRNGVQYIPHLDFMFYLDPEYNYLDTYNRYANISMAPPDIGEIQTVKEGYYLLSQDRVEIVISPCDERLKNAGITHFLFHDPPEEHHLSCFDPNHTVLYLNPGEPVWIYERKSE